MDFKKRAKELVAKMTLAEKMSQMLFDSEAIPRLGIPAYTWLNEALHGVARSGVATVFPQAIALAASFNKNLMKEIGVAISDEARAKYNEYKKFGNTLIYQGLTFWSPNINIFRDPRWGRGHETYGEDPFLTGEMGTAFIKGMQDDYDPSREDKKYRKVDTTLKHYAVHSGPEGLRHGFNVNVSKKDLYETYLAAFKYCIDNAHPAAVMGAYNRVDGEPCCGSKKLLQDILYGEFGFDGYVVSDCGAICDINQHHKVTNNEAESAALAVNNGCQLNCGSAYKFLKVAVAEGLIEEETITKAVEKLYEARFALGMFDKTEYDNIGYDVVDSDEHRTLAREASAQSMVLLKNDGILPLKNNNIKTIAVIGPNADNKNILLGNYNGWPSKYTTLLKGIQDTAEASGKKVLYSQGCYLTKEVPEGSWQETFEREALIIAKKSDVIIICMGLTPQLEGEEGDAYNSEMSGDKPNINLPRSQLKLFEALKEIGKPIIYINVTGSALDLRFAEQGANAVLQCFYPGQDGGAALADIIFGKISPSGRLPVTFYASDDDLPPFENYDMEGRTYRYMKCKPLYPFGYGLSYNNYKYENLKCPDEIGEEKLKLSFDIFVMISIY
jgi:beta-glucosidase